MEMPREKEEENLKYKDKFILWYYLPGVLTSVSKVHFSKTFLCYLLNYLTRRYPKTVYIQNRQMARPGLKHAHSFISFLTHKRGIVLIDISQHLIQILYIEEHYW